MIVLQDDSMPIGKPALVGREQYVVREDSICVAVLRLEALCGML